MDDLWKDEKYVWETYYIQPADMKRCTKALSYIRKKKKEKGEKR